MTNFFLDNNLKKKAVIGLIFIFGFISILIFLLVIVYYTTPDNYQLIDFDEEKNNFKNIGKIDIDLDLDLGLGLGFGSNTVFNLKEYLTSNNVEFDDYFRISSKTPIIFKNSFKSQNVDVDENKIFMSKFNSQILITSDTNKKITVYLYKKN